jgi:hypothetical protein
MGGGFGTGRLLLLRKEAMVKSGHEGGILDVLDEGGRVGVCGSGEGGMSVGLRVGMIKRPREMIASIWAWLAQPRKVATSV